MDSCECDVLIVGGGIAGMAAALISARGGARTLLIEKDSQLGGVLRTGLGFPVCGLFDSAGRLLNGGLCRDVLAAFNIPSQRIGKVHVWPCPSGELIALFTEWLECCDMATVATGMPLTAIEEQDGRIATVWAGGRRIRPRVVVDCSGTGVVISLSSARQLKSDGDVLAGLTLRFAGIADDALLPFRIPHSLRQSGLPGYLRFSTYLSPDCVKLAFPPYIGRDAWQRDIERVVEHLRQSVAAFRNCRLVETSPSLLPRESTRLAGEYVLTEEDALGCARFEDAVTACAWPIERWCVETGPEYDYLPDGGDYQIPLRCLRSANVPNLLAAGVTISATSGAVASSRVMGCCMALGEAAGRDAAERCL